MTDQARTRYPVRFRDLLAAEWVKLWSLRSTTWVLLLTVLGVVGVNVDAAAADYQNYPHYGAQIKAAFVPWWVMRDAFNIGACEVLIVIAGTIGAIAICGEYSTGLIRVTFVAVPARRSVLGAKAVVVGAVMLGTGSVIALTSFFVTRAILSGRHVGMSVTDPRILRLLAVSAFVAPVAALIGMGLGGVIRHTATTVMGTTFLLGLLPFLVDSRTRRWVIDLHNAMLLPAWQRLVEPAAPFGAVSRPTVAGALVVFVAWPLLAMLCATLMIHRRDV